MVVKELYKEEVKELTVLLRTEWEDIQEILNNQNLDFNKTYLLGFIESEDDTELGLFYTENKKLIRFERNSNDLKLTFVSKESIKNEFPQVIVLDEIENFAKW
jgi:hypothetical protein